MRNKTHKYLNGLHILLIPVANSDVVRVEVLTEEEYDAHEQNTWFKSVLKKFNLKAEKR
jgi:hypothetical protein|tara:strand:- start:345 stop:521 length:177 start_codon:yes stop_codon:yes gene_type:complete